MNILVIGGAKTSNIIEALDKCFSKGSVTFLMQEGIDGMERFYDTGRLFERVIVLEYGLTYNHDKYDVDDARERLNKFLEAIATRGRNNPKMVFVCGSEPMARMVYEETQMVSESAVSLLKGPQYTVTFMVEAASKSINALEDAYGYETALRKRLEEEKKAAKKEEVDEEEDVGFQVDLGGLLAGSESNEVSAGDLEDEDMDSVESDDYEEDSFEVGGLPGLESDGTGDESEDSGEPEAGPEVKEPEQEESECEPDGEEVEPSGSTDGDTSDASDAFMSLFEHDESESEPEEEPSEPAQTEETKEPEVEPSDIIAEANKKLEDAKAKSEDTKVEVAQPIAVKQQKFGFGHGKKEKKAKQKPVAPVAPKNVPVGIMGGHDSAEGTLRSLLNTYKLRGHIMAFTGTPKSGKTTLIGNMANLVSGMGYNVLMVDLDIKGRGLSYFSKDTYEAVHGLETARSSLMEALKTGASIQAVADIVSPGLHLLTSGLAAEPIEDMVTSSRVNKLLSSARSQYNLILVEIPWDLAVGKCSNTIYNCDDLVITVEDNTSDYMRLLGMMCDIENEETNRMIWRTSRLIVTKEITNGSGSGKFDGRAKSPEQALEVMDSELTTLLGEEAEYRFSDIPVKARFCFDTRFIEQIYSDIDLTKNSGYREQIVSALCGALM